MVTLRCTKRDWGMHARGKLGVVCSQPNCLMQDNLNTYVEIALQSPQCRHGVRLRGMFRDAIEVGEGKLTNYMAEIESTAIAQQSQGCRFDTKNA
jgi:hypothetical protein